MRVAVVGAGIAGLGAAHALQGQARVSLFEASPRLGGHANTVDVRLDGISHGVDTGFLVFNHRTYPRLTRLFDSLGVDIAESEMSFSVQVPAEGLEWSGHDLASVFAQRRNLVRPEFIRMLAQIARFNRLCTGIAKRGEAASLDQSVAHFLDQHGFGAAFRRWYLLPMIGSIWSCPTEQMLAFPIGTLIRFCHNHGLITLADRPQWLTVRGGSRRYVERIAAGLHDVRNGCAVRGIRRLPPGDGRAGVLVASDAGTERFDQVVLACHADQALALLDDATAAERSVLGALRTQPNRAVLHTDPAVLPKRRRAWAAWNYARSANAAEEDAAVHLHYLINRLQPLPWSRPVVVSLNPDPARMPDPARVLAEFDYRHPVFDRAAVAAQSRLAEIQGAANLWFCGAWTGYGFHEDGLASAQTVADALLRQQPQLAEAA